MNEEKIKQEKLKIDRMDHVEMARLWRFAPSGHPYFDSTLPLYDHFKARFNEYGGMTPTISKQIGWDL
jgi:hypothetical protein